MGKTPTATSFFVPGYIPQLDGLRGVAILLVLIGHSGFLEALPHAGVLQYTRFGVDLFFVLSGFLITGILADSKGSPHYFRNFYARRALRIWPLYYLVLFFAFIVAPLFVPAMRSTAARVWPAFAFYVQNLAYHGIYPFGLGATWSLALEEQFYATWPFFVFLLSKQKLAIISVALVVGSLAFRVFYYVHNAPLGLIHQFTLSRLDAIALGSLAALWVRSRTCTFVRWRKGAYQFLGLGAGGALVARILMHRNSSVVGYTFLAIAFTGLLGISLASDSRSSCLGRILSADWLRYIGKTSYGIYLLHYPIFIGWGQFISSRSSSSSDSISRDLLAFAGQILLTLMAASISWRFFEQRILHFKERFPSGSEMHWPDRRRIEGMMSPERLASGSTYSVGGTP